MMLQFFTPESVMKMKVLNETYCNTKDMKWTSWNGAFKDLLLTERLRRGKLIWFYPPKGKNGLEGGYKPENHVCKEQEEFQQSYITYIKENMEWKAGVKAKVDRRLLGLARKMKKNPKEITYVGVHVRRTDHLKYIKEQNDMDPLDGEYFNDAMDYFRYNNLPTTNPVYPVSFQGGI